MTYTVTTDVFCDSCGSWVAGYSGNRASRYRAWLAAKKAGWTMSAKEHICPKCAASRNHPERHKVEGHKWYLFPGTSGPSYRGTDLFQMLARKEVESLKGMVEVSDPYTLE